MAGQKIELGPSGKTVAENVRRIREQKALTFTEISRSIASRGRSISPLAVRRIEEGQRRVDVDDLIALSAVLGVSPITLLAPNTATASERIVATAIVETLRAEDFWAWLRADLPPSNGDGLDWLSINANLNSLPEWKRLEKENLMLVDLEPARAKRREELERLRQNRLTHDGDD